MWSSEQIVGSFVSYKSCVLGIFICGVLFLNHPLFLGLSDHFGMVAIPVQGKVGGFSKILEQPPKQTPTLLSHPCFFPSLPFLSKDLRRNGVIVGTSWNA